MGDIIEFVEFPKLARLSREVIVTEKLDGTNAQVCIAPGEPGQPGAVATYFDERLGQNMAMYAGSRNRWITRESDNFGFAAWVHENVDLLKALGPGSHFGEWWGSGIQRGYALDHRRWSLFNVQRWAESRPACCHVVPVLFRGLFDTHAIEEALARLAKHGSVAAPGFTKPEGVVVYHVAGNVGFKKTLEKDDVPKGAAHAR